MTAGLRDSIDPFVLRFVFGYWAAGQKPMPLNHYETAVLVYWRMHIDPKLIAGKSDTQVDQFILDRFRPSIHRELEWCLVRGWIHEVQKGVFTMTTEGVNIVNTHTKS